MNFLISSTMRSAAVTGAVTAAEFLLTAFAGEVRGDSAFVGLAIRDFNLI